MQKFQYFGFLLVVLFCFMSNSPTTAQAVGINTQNIPDDVILRIFGDASEPKGILTPRYTQEEINQLNPETEGLLLYNKSLKNFQMWRGNKWTGLDGGIWQQLSSNSENIYHESGYVGIQNTNPQSPLHISGNVNQLLTIDRTGPENGTSQLTFKNSQESLNIGMGVYGQFGLTRGGEAFGSMLWIEKDKPGELKVNDQWGGTVPRGGIIMWSGNPEDLPEGWVLCDGNNGTPNLSGKFIVGYDKGNAAYNTVGKKGGKESVQLSSDEMPSHNHDFSATTSKDGSHNHYVTLDTGSGLGSTKSLAGVKKNYTKSTDTSNAGEHSHTVSGSTRHVGGNKAHENRPPYYVIAYIMKK